MENEIELFPMKEFSDFQEFDKFCAYLKWLEKEDVITEIEKGPVPVMYSNDGNEEKWYLDRNNQIWVLIRPDYPFKGFFKQLSDITRS